MGVRVNVREHLFNFLRGFSMGAADIVPGVSGGTIALITGIYPRMIRGIDNAIAHGAASIQMLVQGKLRNAGNRLVGIDFALFIPLGLGIVTAFLSLSRVIHYLLEQEVALVFAFFLGLILASCIFVLRGIPVFNAGTVTAFLGGLLFAFFFVGFDPLAANHSLPVIFLSGSFAICAMLLPGISGSFLLVFLGQYEHMLAAINRLELLTLAVFAMGAAAGLTAFSRFIDYLLTNHRPVTFAIITGIMAGSLRLPFRQIVSVEYSLPPVVLLGLIGIAIVFILEFVFRER